MRFFGRNIGFAAHFSSATRVAFPFVLLASYLLALLNTKLSVDGMNGREWLKLLVLGLCLAVLTSAVFWLDQRHPALLACFAPCLIAVAAAAAVFCLKNKDGSGWPETRDIGPTSLVLAISFAGGFYAIYAAVAYVDFQDRVAGILAVEMWSLAASAFGFWVGFLFGIPRVFQRDFPSSMAPADSAGDVQHKVNTNLEQISDWLTKIIVGLGLVQLHEIPGFLKRVSVWAASCLPLREPAASARVASFATAFLVYFAICGFLAGYLLTRIYLSSVFRRTDQPPRPVNVPLSKPADSEFADKLRTFWCPVGNIADKDHEEKLLDWLASNSLGAVPLAKFLNSADYSEQRKRAVEQFKL